MWGLSLATEMLVNNFIAACVQSDGTQHIKNTAARTVRMQNMRGKSILFSDCYVDGRALA
jgi:hypothetical protein